MRKLGAGHRAAGAATPPTSRSVGDCLCFSSFMQTLPPPSGGTMDDYNPINQIDVLHSCGHNRSKIAFLTSQSSSSSTSLSSSPASATSSSSSAGHDSPTDDDGCGDCSDGGGGGGGNGASGVDAQRHHYDPQPCNYCRATRGHWKSLVRRVTEEYYVRRYGKKAYFRRVRVWIMDHRGGRHRRRP